METRDLAAFAAFAAWIGFWAVWNYRRRRKALRFLRRWAEEARVTLMSTAPWQTWKNYILIIDKPPFWRWGAYPFHVQVRTERGEIEEGWVLCDARRALAVWGSGRIHQTEWIESEKTPESIPPTGLWDQEHDGPSE